MCKKRNESQRSDADHRMHMFSLSFFLFKILALLINQTARSDLVNTLNNTHTLYLLFPSYTAILPAFTVFCFPVTSSSHSLSPSSPRGLSANLLPLLLVWFSVCFARWGEAGRVWGGACSLTGDAACERSSNLSLGPCWFHYFHYWETSTVAIPLG